MIYMLKRSPHNEYFIPYYAKGHKGLKKIAVRYLTKLFPDFHNINEDYCEFKTELHIDFKRVTVPTLIVIDPEDGSEHKFYIEKITPIDQEEE